jgi:hypothetical protein
VPNQAGLIDFHGQARGSSFFSNFFISSSSGGLFFDAPVILLSEVLIGALSLFARC